MSFSKGPGFFLIGPRYLNVQRDRAVTEGRECMRNSGHDFLTLNRVAEPALGLANQMTVFIESLYILSLYLHSEDEQEPWPS